MVESGLTDATMFLPNGEVVQPTEVLYRHPVLLLRGSFDPVMKVHLTMLNQAHEGFSDRLAEQDRGAVVHPTPPGDLPAGGGTQHHRPQAHDLFDVFGSCSSCLDHVGNPGIHRKLAQLLCTSIV